MRSSVVAHTIYRPTLTGRQACTLAHGILLYGQDLYVTFLSLTSPAPLHGMQKIDAKQRKSSDSKHNSDMWLLATKKKKQFLKLLHLQQVPWVLASKIPSTHLRRM